MSYPRRKPRIGVVVSVLLATILPCLFLVAKASAADAELDVVIGGASRHFTRDELLHRKDIASVAIANDVSYGRAMNYQAVPVAALLAGCAAVITMSVGHGLTGTRSVVAADVRNARIFIARACRRAFDLS